MSAMQGVASLSADQQRVLTQLQGMGVPVEWAWLVASRATDYVPGCTTPYTVLRRSVVWATQPEGFSFWNSVDEGFLSEWYNRSQDEINAGHALDFLRLAVGCLVAINDAAAGAHPQDGQKSKLEKIDSLRRAIAVEIKKLADVW